MEILMEEIRTPPILRRVHNTTLSDSNIVTCKKKLMPSSDLIANLSEEVSNEYITKEL